MLNIGDNHNAGSEIRVESKDLYRLLTVNDRLQVPAGHAVLVANSKSQSYQEFTAQGRPVMDRLGRDMINLILS